MCRSAGAHVGCKGLARARRVGLRNDFSRSLSLSLSECVSFVLSLARARIRARARTHKTHVCINTSRVHICGYTCMHTCKWICVYRAWDSGAQRAWSWPCANRRVYILHTYAHCMSNRSVHIPHAYSRYMYAQRSFTGVVKAMRQSIADNMNQHTTSPMLAAKDGRRVGRRLWSEDSSASPPRVCVRTRTHPHVRTHTRTHTHTHTHTRAHTHTNTHTRKHTHTYIHTYTHMCM